MEHPLDISDGLDPDFVMQYGTHCQAVALAAVEERFEEVEGILLQFWHETVPTAGWAARLAEVPYRQFVESKDVETYENVLSSLIPDVFRNLSATFTKQIRHFAKNFGPWLHEALGKQDERLTERKIAVGTAFAQKLRRYTGLNHLAQAARTVLGNHTHVSQMLSDYQRVDFSNILEQTQWVCEGCDGALVLRLEARFRQFHKDNNTLEQWALWLQEVVRESLQRYENGDHFVGNAREFLLRWSFLSSLVIRDLTLRSATSFGMFHLMRLLCDEYVFFLIERAIQTGTCPTLTHEANGGTEIKAKSELYSDDIAGGHNDHNDDDDDLDDDDYEDDEPTGSKRQHKQEESGATKRAKVSAK